MIISSDILNISFSYSSTPVWVTLVRSVAFRALVASDSSSVTLCVEWQLRFQRVFLNVPAVSSDVDLLYMLIQEEMSFHALAFSPV